jgi:hypothetical protein
MSGADKRCETHGDFRVADTVFPEAMAKNYTRE